MAKEMGCEAYFHETKNKKRIYERFAERKKKEKGEGWEEKKKRKKVIMAISAFGMRIDVARIRMIMHTSEPREILEYAQESDKAGRDRKSSEAIIIRGRISSRKGGGEAERSEEGEAGRKERAKIREFLEAGCQRRAINSYLNDRVDREGCEWGEKRYQKCGGERRENRKESELGLEKNGRKKEKRKGAGSELE